MTNSQRNSQFAVAALLVDSLGQRSVDAVKASVFGNESFQLAVGGKFFGGPHFVGEQVPELWSNYVRIGGDDLTVVGRDLDREAPVVVAFKAVEAFEGDGVDVSVNEAGDGRWLRVEG